MVTERPFPFAFLRLRRLLAFLGVLVVLYAAVLAWFFVKEDGYVFHPERGTLLPPPAHLHLDSHDVKIRTSDGVTLVGRLIPPAPGLDEHRVGWILYFHGAGGNLARAAYNEAWARFRDLGLGVLAIDYRGFGESEGRPSEAGLYRDADAAYAWLTQTMHVPADHIVVYGYSLGTAVAVDLAARVPVAGLVVEGAFSTIAARAAELYPFLPVRVLAHNHFASLDKIARVTAPKLFIHAHDDDVIPISHGRRLYEAAVPPKTFADVAGNHTTAFKVDPNFFTIVARFVASVGLPTPGAQIR
jgi:fermentation-respiration switch protein FrsA (DUF1100 family)